INLPQIITRLRLSLRSKFGQAGFFQTFHSLPAPNLLGEKTEDRFRTYGNFNGCYDEFFGLMEVGVKYWFSKNQDVGLEVFGGNQSIRLESGGMGV
ncbi:MAG: hypothetical protein AAFY45_23865, partial [Bacteroidota bacterium]